MPKTVLPPALTSAAPTPRCLQQTDDAIDRVALRDAAEIELHARRVEADRPIAAFRCTWRYPTRPRTAASSRPCRHAAVILEEAPRFHERADRDVERPSDVRLYSSDCAMKSNSSESTATALCAASRFSCDNGLSGR